MVMMTMYVVKGVAPVCSMRVPALLLGLILVVSKRSKGAYVYSGIELTNECRIVNDSYGYAARVFNFSNFLSL